jgi:transposase-like protein
MPKTHPSYPAEYRRRMVEQVRAGRLLKELAREFEPSVESIRQWVRQAQLDGGERSGRRNTSTGGIGMTIKKRRSDRSGRAALRSPRRPPLARPGELSAVLGIGCCGSFE